MRTIVTEDIKTAALADALVAREHEMFGYQVNIDNYTAMLAVLPTGDWPEPLAKWKATAVASLPAEMDDATVQQIVDLQYRDRLRSLLRTERVEQGKSRRVWEALQGQIAPDKIDAAIDEAVIRRAADLATATTR
jgi:hypothetical protein